MENTSIESAQSKRDELNRRMVAIYQPFMSNFPQVIFSEMLANWYGVYEVRHLTLEQYESLVNFMYSAVPGVVARKANRRCSSSGASRLLARCRERVINFIHRDLAVMVGRLLVAVCISFAVGAVLLVLDWALNYTRKW